MTKTVVLGANGRLGRVLMRGVRRDGLSWTGQARTGAAVITDPLSAKVFETGGTIINMAGHTGPDMERLAKSNVELVKDIFDRAADAGVGHVVLASSGAVYGARGNGAFAEGDDLNPQSAYAESKADMERVAADHKGGVKTTILRIGNVAGSDALTSAAIAHLERDQAMPLHLLPDGTTPVRSYIGPLDLFKVVLTVATHPPESKIRILNVAHPQTTTLEDVLLGYRAHIYPDLSWQDAPAPAGTPATVTLTTKRLAEFVKLPKVHNIADYNARQVAQDLSP